MALNTQRYNYNGHDIYVFASGSDKYSENKLLHQNDNPYSYAIMVDGKVIGNVEPEMWFMKDQHTFTLDDGTQLHLKASARIFSEKVELYADGVKLEPGTRHNRNLENLRRLADAYKILGPLTNEQFLAIKSLSSPVIYHRGELTSDVTALPYTAKVQELHSDELLQKRDNQLAVGSNMYLIQPNDYVEISVNSGTATRPIGLYYDGYETYATGLSINVTEMYLPGRDKGFSDWVPGTLAIKDCVIDGTITLHPDGQVINGCLTTIDYTKALELLEETLSQMPEDARIPYEENIKSLINGDTTLVEFATVRNLAEQGYELTDELLMSIASKDQEWQEALVPRFFDEPEVEEKEETIDREPN